MHRRGAVARGAERLPVNQPKSLLSGEVNDISVYVQPLVASRSGGFYI